MTRGVVLEVRLGAGAPASIALVPGTSLEPTSFGRTAMWRIDAEGVLEVHGFLYYDGAALYMQSAEEAFPVLVNRRRLGRAWTEVHAPSTVLFGEAQIDVHETDRLARTGAAVAIGPRSPRSGAPPAPDEANTNPAAPAPPRGPWDASKIATYEEIAGGPGKAPYANDPTPYGPGPTPFGSRGAFVPASDGDVTRFAPLGGSPLGPPPPPSPEFAQPPPAPPSSSGFLPVPSPRVVPAPPPSSPLLSSGRVPLPATEAPTVTPGRTLLEKAKADWYATSLPKRVLLILSPFVLLSYFKLLFGNDKDAEKEEPTAPTSSEVASAAPPVPLTTAAPPPPVPTAPVAVTPPVQTVVPVPVGATPQPLLPGPTALPAQQPVPTLVPVQPAPPVATPVAPTAAIPPGKTLERAAVDAYREGNLPVALVLYQRLAQERPENPAFAEAVRIIADRLDAGPR